MRVFNFYQIGRLVAEPLGNTNPAQALGNELDLAVFAHGMVDANGAAGSRQVIRVEFTIGRHGAVDVEQGQRLVLSIGDPFYGLVPGGFINHHRHDLGREERPIVYRQQIQLVRQVLIGQNKPCTAGLCSILGDVFNVVGILIAHRFTFYGQLLGMRWRRRATISIAEIC